MIGKITGGGSFGGALEYLTKPKEQKQEQEKASYRERLKDPQHTPGEPAPPFEAGERHRVIGGDMSGETRGELAREFEAISRQRPDIEKPVHHTSLSAGAEDKISVDQWREIAAEYVERMGFKDAPYVVIQHRDGKTDHVHILTSRVDVNGKVVSDWQCKQRAEVVLRDIEQKYGLEQVKSSREVERAAPTRGELERFRRTGELSAKMALQARVDLALKDSPTVGEFIDRLQLSGVETIPYIQNTGRVSGVTFRRGKELMKGSDLGRGFSWNALCERGLDYRQERDRPAVEAAREHATAGRAEPVITQPGPGFAGLARDVGRELGDYLIDRANPLHQIESQVRMIEQAGRSVANGVAMLQNAATKQGDYEQSQRAAVLDDSARGGVERLQQSGVSDPLKDGRDGLERLSSVPGLERKDSPVDLLDKTPELTPALEPMVEERSLAPVIEFLL